MVSSIATYHKHLKPDTKEYDDYHSKKSIKKIRKYFSNMFKEKYFEWYKNRKKLMDKYDNILHTYKRITLIYFISLVIATVLYTSFLLIGYFFFELYIAFTIAEPFIQVPLIASAIVTSFVLSIVLLLLIVTVVTKQLILSFFDKKGYEIVLEGKSKLSKEYVKKHMPRILKIFNATGAGKDTTASAFAIIISEYLSEICLELMDTSENLLYFVDFYKLRTEVLNNFDTAKRFITNNNKILKIHVKDFLLKNQGFLIRVKDVNKMIDDWNMIDKDQTYQSDYLFDDGNKKKHLLEYLVDYIKIYLRYYYVKNFVWTNQPFHEIVDRQHNYILGAKQFSVETMKYFSSEVIEHVDYKKKIKYTIKKNKIDIIPEMAVVIETESGTLYSNLDKKEQAKIVKTGQHRYKAYQRHLNGKWYWHITIDQRPDRTIKVLREQDQALMCVKNLRIIEGGVPKWVIDKLERLEEKRAEKHLEDTYSLDKKISILEQRKAKYEGRGFVKVDIVVSDNGAYSADEYKLSEFLRNPKVKENSYSLELVFPRDITHNRNDTHFLKAIKENQLNDEEKEIVHGTDGYETADEVDHGTDDYEIDYSKGIDPFNCPNWPNNFELTKKDVRFMGYDTLNQMFGVTQKDLFNDRRLYTVTKEPYEGKRG